MQRRRLRSLRLLWSHVSGALLLGCLRHACCMLVSRGVMAAARAASHNRCSPRRGVALSSTRRAAARCKPQTLRSRRATSCCSQRRRWAPSRAATASPSRLRPSHSPATRAAGCTATSACGWCARACCARARVRVRGCVLALHPNAAGQARKLRCRLGLRARVCTCLHACARLHAKHACMPRACGCSPNDATAAAAAATAALLHVCMQTGGAGSAMVPFTEEDGE